MLAITGRGAEAFARWSELRIRAAYVRKGEPMTVSESNGPDVVDAIMLAERLGRHEPVTVLDVRRPERWSEDRESIPGAVWVPHDQIPRRAQDLSRDRDLVVYCS
jgi:hypothetical protein